MTTRILAGDARAVLARDVRDRLAELGPGSVQTIPEMRASGLSNRAARAQSKMNQRAWRERGTRIAEALTETQLAYLAGLIDGEGSLECQREMQRKGRTPSYVLRLAITMATPEPLSTVGAWLEQAPKCYPATDPSRQPRWCLNIRSAVATALLRRCIPYLLLKRDQAELILAIDAVRRERSPGRGGPPGPGRRMPPDAIGEMERLYRSLRALKSNKRPVSCR